MLDLGTDIDLEKDQKRLEALTQGLFNKDKPEGLEWLQLVLKAHGGDTTTFSENSHVTAFNEGRRSILLELIHEAKQQIK